MLRRAPAAVTAVTDQHLDDSDPLVEVVAGRCVLAAGMAASGKGTVRCHHVLRSRTSAASSERHDWNPEALTTTASETGASAATSSRRLVHLAVPTNSPEAAAGARAIEQS
jgi:hypothetical protein